MGVDVLCQPLKAGATTALSGLNIDPLGESFLHAYIDESGNTGFNLFDVAQPNFLSVAMSSQVDFDDVFQERVRQISQNAGVDFLHASELGLDGVESIAGSVIELVDFSQVRFYFAAVNKRDVAAMKFYDAIFDPGENPAAPRHSYVIRSLKFVLLLKFLAILEEEDIRLFWKAMTSSPSQESEREAMSAIDNAIQRVGSLPDARSRQLIGDTLSWARNNIGKFSIWTPRKRDRHGHLPNLFTFPALLTGVSDTAKLWDCRIDKIVHDRQSQFGETLRQWHSLFEGLEPQRIFHFGDTPIRFADIRDSQFETRASQKSPGLQVVDIVLWTFARSLSEQPLGARSKELFELCFSPDDFNFMSLGTIVTEINYTLVSLMNRPLGEDQLLGGMKFIEYAEQLRQDSIREDLDNQLLAK